VSSRTARAIQRNPVSKNQKQQQQQKKKKKKKKRKKERSQPPYQLLPREGRTMVHTRRKNYTPQKASKRLTRPNAQMDSFRG
jgi:hypothetical protein